MLDILLADRWSHYCKCFRTFLPRVCISNNMHCSIHLISTGVFAARKGAYLAYIQKSPPSKGRSSGQESVEENTKGPQVALWSVIFLQPVEHVHHLFCDYYPGNATMAICKTVTQENNLLLQRMRGLQDFANNFSSSSTLSWVQSNSIYVVFASGTSLLWII